MGWGRLTRLPMLVFLPAALTAGVLAAGGGAHVALANPEQQVSAPTLTSLTFLGHLPKAYKPRGSGIAAVRVPDVDATGCTRLILAPRGTQAVVSVVTTGSGRGHINAHEELVAYPSPAVATVAYQRFLTSATGCAQHVAGPTWTLTRSPLGRRAPAFILRPGTRDTEAAHGLVLRGRYVIYVGGVSAGGVRAGGEGVTGLSDAQLSTLMGAAVAGLGDNS